MKMSIEKRKGIVMKRNLKFILFGGFILFLGISVIFVSFNQRKTKNSSQKENNTSLSKTVKEKKDEVVNSVSSADKKEITTVEGQTSAEKLKNIAEFKKEVISNGLYLNLNGAIEPADEKNMKDIEKKFKNPVIQDVEKDGKMIKVLSDSGEQTEGDK
jgi:cytoskeletal protein RodZ